MYYTIDYPTWIIIAVGTVFLIVIIVVAVLCIWHHIRKKTRDQTREENRHLIQATTDPTVDPNSDVIPEAMEVNGDQVTTTDPEE